MGIGMDLSFFDLIQKTCLPGIWSKGVSIARSDTVLVDQQKEDEIILRVQMANQVVSRKVTLWPVDQDWFCDCEDRNDVCAHVAATVIALKSGKTKTYVEGNPLDGEAIKVSQPSLSVARLSYRFTRDQGSLFFERWIVYGDGKEERLGESLVSRMGGIQSGRIKALPIAATQEDYGVDYALVAKNRGVLDRGHLGMLLKALSLCANIKLDDQPITVSSKPYQINATITDFESGFQLTQKEENKISEIFKNGAVLCGSVLKAIDSVSLTPEEREFLKPPGKTFSFQEAPRWVKEIIPALQKKINLEILTHKLPKLRMVQPKIVLKAEPLGETEVLSVVPQIVLPHPSSLEQEEVLMADPSSEKNLIRKLQMELQLAPGQLAKFEGEAAVDFILKAQNWEKSGSGTTKFQLNGELIPKLHLNENDFSISFSNQFQGEPPQLADSQRVFQAWRENANYVPLLSGGWAALPKNWLSCYGERVQKLLAAKASNDENKSLSLPRYLFPELIQLCDELKQSYPESLKKLKTLLEKTDEIPSAVLPKDLTVELRHYQEKGVNWLCFLKEAKMGALLADDMGLGKTLQALCALQGKTLIITPTSVLFSWTEQIEKFRPLLKVCVFYGNQRKIDSTADIFITTYGLLRLNQELLLKQKWDTIVIDEAQTIKNPESQISKAVHQLQGDFKIALSGTPIENRLEDLWSQFEFLNPGLLGSRELFRDSFSDTVSRGNENSAQYLRKLIKPFILRRLKKEVAPELPPRTEIVLKCELTPQEREIYEALLISTRKEVLEELEMKGNVLGALELLLRLRQACCHCGLVPGQSSERSSKVDLLLETLENSISLGHRALVFSQWTSYLDLIQSQFEKNGISYTRLDGSTRNRQEVVNQFQNELRYSVMLISLKAGGVGLTLTAADHLFLMDPWWNPAVEDQAADRSHRIGQTNPVLIHRLVAQDSIEEKVLALQQSKKELANAILQDGSAAVSLTKADILELLK